MMDQAANAHTSKRKQPDSIPGPNKSEITLPTACSRCNTFATLCIAVPSIMKVIRVEPVIRLADII